MIGVLASIRPDSWNFPLFLHVAGAAVFFGALTVGAVAQLTKMGELYTALAKDAYKPFEGIVSKAVPTAPKA